MICGDNCAYVQYSRRVGPGPGLSAAFERGRGFLPHQGLFGLRAQCGPLQAAAASRSPRCRSECWMMAEIRATSLSTAVSPLAAALRWRVASGLAFAVATARALAGL